MLYKQRQTKFDKMNISKVQFMFILCIFIGLHNIYSYSQSSLLDLERQSIAMNNDSTYLPAISLSEEFAFIKGTIHGYNSFSEGRVRIVYHNPIMNEMETFDVDIAYDGHFLMQIPVISNATCLFLSDYYREYILLLPGDTCYIDIDADKISDITAFDSLRRGEIDNEYIHFSGAFADINSELNYLRFWSYSLNLFKEKNQYQDLSQYKTYILSILEKSLSELSKSTISDPTKELITINLQHQAILSLLDDHFLQKMYFSKEESSISSVDVDYFSFLEGSDINSMHSFYGRNFPYIIDRCRKLEDMTIPLSERIKKMGLSQEALTYDDVERQKDYLARILKINNGPAFDLLRVLNYTSKIKQQMTLDEWEISDLMQVKNQIYYDYVMRENEALLSHLQDIRRNSTSIILDVTTEKNDNYFEEIISSYKGNIVLVNYWSLDCIFARNAIRVIEALKKNYINKKVVFIYVTDDRSLYPKWENAALQYEGIHFRLNKNQMAYITSKYELSGTPGFLLFDKKGKCIFNRVGSHEETIEALFFTIDKYL